MLGRPFFLHLLSINTVHFSNVSLKKKKKAPPSTHDMEVGDAGSGSGSGSLESCSPASFLQLWDTNRCFLTRRT